MKSITELKALLAKGKTQEVITGLSECCKRKDLQNEILQISARFARANRDNRLDIMSSGSLGIELNRINAALLELLDEAGSGDPGFEEGKDSQGGGDIVGRDKIGRQINMGANSTYIEGDFSDSRHTILPPSRLRIQFLAANPSNEAHLQTDVEYRKIREEMERGSHREKYEWLQPEFALTLSNLLRAMNFKPHIVHFSGHGEREGIYITDEQNFPQQIPLTALKRLFSPLKGITQIVLLNACYSATQAEAISNFGMYVVGHLKPVEDGAAIGFARGLYNGLGSGKEFPGAFNDAMIVLETLSAQDAAGVQVWKDGKLLDL